MRVKLVIGTVFRNTRIHPKCQLSPRLPSLLLEFNARDEKSRQDLVSFHIKRPSLYSGLCWMSPLSVWLSGWLLWQGFMFSSGMHSLEIGHYRFLLNAFLITIVALSSLIRLCIACVVGITSLSTPKKGYVMDSGKCRCKNCSLYRPICPHSASQPRYLL
jgi:hypothetical protein